MVVRSRLNIGFGPMHGAIDVVIFIRQPCEMRIALPQGGNPVRMFGKITGQFVGCVCHALLSTAARVGMKGARQDMFGLMDQRVGMRSNSGVWRMNSR